MSQELFDTTYQEEVFLIRPKPIVVITSSWDSLSDKERELLSKIISALKISIDAVTIISQSVLNITFFHGKTNKLIYFGELPSGISQYEVLESGEVSFICSESIIQLIDNEASRKKLWQALKSLFAV